MWKIVKSNTNYEISDKGDVKSLRKNKILTPKKNHDGYLRIQLWDHGKCRFVSIHRLVAEAFLENPNNLPFVNHKNGIKNDNRVENLEWVTQKENIGHSWKTGLSKSQLNNKATSKAIIQLDFDGNVVKIYPSTMEIERNLGIAHSNISYACKHNKKIKGFYWKYVETSND